MLVRYATSGLAAYIVDLSVFLFFHTAIKSPLIVATSIAFICGLTFSFLANKLFVFSATRSDARHRTSKQIFFYSMLVSFNLVFTYLFMEILLNRNVDPAISKTLATAIITAWNYIIYNRVIFKKTTQS